MAYPDVILPDAPRTYLRLGQTVGVSGGQPIVPDSGTSAINALTNFVLPGVSTPVLSGSLVNDSDGSRSFNGTNTSYIGNGYGGYDPSICAITTPAMSVEMWVQTSTNALQCLATQSDGSYTYYDPTNPNKPYGYIGNYGSYTLQITAAGKIEWSIFSSAQTTSFDISGGFVTDGNAHHVVATRDGTTAKIYVDGSLVVSGVDAGGQLTAHYIYLGINYYNYYTQGINYQLYTGLMDEFATYTYALSQAQIVNHYEVGTFNRSRGLTYNKVVLNDVPVGYWRLGEASGASSVDSTGNGYVGVQNGTAPVSVTGALNNDVDAALSYSGSNWTEIANNASLTPTTAFSLECWFNASAATPAGPTALVFKATPTNVSPYWSYGLTTHQLGGIVFDLTTSGNYYSILSQNRTLLNGMWHFIVATWNGSLVSIYADGVLDTTSNVGGTISAYSTPLQFGRTYYTGGGVGNYVGALDEVALYNTCLSAAQVKTHYIAGIKNHNRAAAPAGLVLG